MNAKDCYLCGDSYDDPEDEASICPACARRDDDVHYHMGGRANCPACVDRADYLADQEKDG